MAVLRKKEGYISTLHPTIVLPAEHATVSACLLKIVY